jgi:hypothetical protein
MRISTLALVSACTTTLAQQWPLHDNGLNDVVEWDHYSLIGVYVRTRIWVVGLPGSFLLTRAPPIAVNGERLYMWSGEIHYWRIPNPELWIDVLQKIKVRPNHRS